MPRILIVEDEEIMRTGLRDTLLDAGFAVETAGDGHSGLSQALAENPDLLLLDIMLPGLDGLAVCRALRRSGRWCPVLMLTARGLVDDRVDGLDAGADDYLVKPFSGAELLARVRALLRGRAHATPSQSPLPQADPIHPATTAEVLTLGETTIDFTRHQCRSRDGELLPMTAKEFAVLRLLVLRRGRPVTRDQFLDLVWGLGAGITTRTVDNHIAMLRAKLEPDPARPHWIRTVHKIGYRLETAD